MKDETEKLAIIMSGGGMKASFGVGVILALAEKYNIREPHLLICSSGSAGTGAYYLSKQYQSIRNIWINLVSSKKLLNIKRFWKIVDIDYLIDEIFKKQDPLKEDLVYKSKTRFLIPALNKNTGKIDYFDNKKEMNVFESMRATKAMPIAFKINPGVRVGKFFYCDSIASSGAQAHIQKAIELGAKKILIIDGNSCWKKDFSDFFFYIWMLFHKRKRRYYKMEKKLADTKVPADVKIFAISPKSKIKVSMFDNNKKSLRQTIEQGYQETIHNSDLKEFLGC